MNATPDNTFADPEQRIADLERQLAEARDDREAELAQCKAERDEALGPPLVCLPQSSPRLLPD
jgi:hypothetical protein